MAKNWQIMLIPDSPLQTDSLPEHKLNLQVVEEAIVNRLLSQREQIITSAQVFADCNINLCGQASRKAALSQIARSAPNVDLVLFYGLRSAHGQSDERARLYASLIDPLSSEQYDAFDLSILPAAKRPDNATTSALPDADLADTGVTYNGITDPLQLKSLATDLGPMIAQSLQNITKQNSFSMQLQGFTVDEVAPLSTFIMSKSVTTELRLVKSEKLNDLFWGYLPTISSSFEVRTGLTQSQFNQLLLAFFAKENIDVLNEYQGETALFKVTRIGNPYTPSLVSSVLLFMATLLFVGLLIRRQYLQNQLEYFATLKSVDSWLSIYNTAKAPWYMLRARWKNQHSYWLRLQRESRDLENQAKLFFDAGDLISAKLFISKSLNINSDAPIANALIEKIAKQESSEQAFSAKEQRVRNKVAKAMNNYRAADPLKALRQAYQALEESADEKKLKRQHKAIKRLIQKINVDFVQPHDVLELTDLNTNEVSIVSALHELNVGRQQNNTLSEAGQALVDRSVQIFIDHKALSRVPKQCKFNMTENGFFIQDMGSTNGTYVQGKQLQKDKQKPLLKQNHVYLGAASELSAVKLELEIDEVQSIMHARIAKQLTHTLDRAELIKVWPNYVHAMRCSFVMTKGDFVLALDTQQDKLRIMSLHDLERSTSCTGLLRIWLGASASIAPLIGFDEAYDNDKSAKDSENHHVRCNNEKLFGIVPLLLPCDIQYKEHHIRIDEYFEYGRPLQHIDHLAIQVNKQNEEYG